MDHVWMVKKAMSVRGTPVTDEQAEEMLREYSKHKDVDYSLVTSQEDFYSDYCNQIQRHLLSYPK